MMLDRRVILSTAMNALRVSRLTPPAVLTQEDLNFLEAALRSSGKAIANR